MQAGNGILDGGGHSPTAGSAMNSLGLATTAFLSVAAYGAVDIAAIAKEIGGKSDRLDGAIY